jgi:hypothetical protein
MCHHHITRAIAQVRAADMQQTAARTQPTAAVRPRCRRHAIVAALIPICALVPNAGALAQPTRDIGSATTKHARAVAHNHHPGAKPGTITFTNPLDRPRGPGTGAGMLDSATTKRARAVARNNHPRATPGLIRFTNPLDRSRGPGAGAGML